MDLGLKGKRALVMGSTRGIGRGIADTLAAEGASVAVCGRDAADAEAAAEEIKSETGADARGYALDLGDDNSVSALIESVGADFGALDIVVCNGGGPPPGGIADVSAEVWAAQFHAMFINQTRIATAFLAGMCERGWGRIAVISSSGVTQPIPNLGISNALRLALIGWVKTLSNEVAGDGVTVNALMPGRIHTSRVDQLDASASERLGKPVEQIVRESHATIPAGRYGTVQEFADVAAFVLSDRASYVTGSALRIDGGFIRGV